MPRLIMYSHVALAIIITATILSLVTTSIIASTPAMASSKGNKEGGPVVQEKVNTGNSNPDKEINKFYSCISKAHQDPPTLEKVDSCYNQTVGGTGSNSGSTAASQTSISTHHKT